MNATETARPARLATFRGQPNIVITGQNADGTYTAEWGANPQLHDDDYHIKAAAGRMICRNLKSTEILAI